MIKTFLKAGFMLVVGLALVGAGIYFIIGTKSFLGESQRAQGEVVELVLQKGSKGITNYHPLVEFKDNRGNVHRFKSKFGTKPSIFKLGQKVEVAYNSNNPKEAKIVSFWTLWLVPLCMLLLGGGGAFLGWQTARKYRLERLICL
jgi:hypothetical protein